MRPPCAVAVALVLVAAPARADESEADRAFREGRELLRAGRYAEATRS